MSVVNLQKVRLAVCCSNLNAVLTETYYMTLGVLVALENRNSYDGDFPLTKDLLFITQIFAHTSVWEYLTLRHWASVSNLVHESSSQMISIGRSISTLCKSIRLGENGGANPRGSKRSCSFNGQHTP